MFHAGEANVLIAAVVLGAVHGAEPGHGWPVAAAYALDRRHKWASGVLASATLGVGHLVSSVAMVLAFFWVQSRFGLGDLWWMNYVAGVLLILLGIREYRHGHGHEHDAGHGHAHEHGHGDDRTHTHERDDADRGHARDHPRDDHGHRSHAHDDGGIRSRLAGALSFGTDDPSDRGFWGIVGFAFVLGFAHEEEFEILALCAGTGPNRCLELMLVYALTVIGALVALTMVLVAGYTRYEERAEAYAEHLPTVSAVVLVAMGVGFLLGVV